MGEAFRGAVADGPLMLAIGAALLAGLVSILSPCVLPLLPGYLSYVTGLAGSDLEVVAAPKPAAGDALGAAAAVGTVAVAVAPRTRQWAVKGRILAGTGLFVLGFSVVFTLTTLLTSAGFTLLTHRAELNIVLGILIILLGVAYLGWIPGLQREARISRLPAAGLAGAPVFGAIFALSWMPCVGPTLGAVNLLAVTTGQTDRAVMLALAYSLGLGLPFILFGLFFRRLLGVFQVIRRHSRWVTRAGGVLLIVVGLSLVTGQWSSFLTWLLTTFNFGEGTLL